MKYRSLGTTGLQVSAVALGTHQFSGEWGVTYSDREVERIVRRAGELGITLIDTAECYGDHSVEAMLGAAIKGARDKWIIATKFGHHSLASFKKTDAWSPAEVESQLDASLRALGTDYIDIYEFHSGSNEVFDNDALWEMLRRQVSLGKIRHLGISFSGDLTMKGDVHQLRQAPQYAVEIAQVVYNRLSPEAENEVLPFCERHHIGVLARVPLSRGLLSGRYRPGTVFPNDDIRAKSDPGFNDERLRKAEEIRLAEVPEGMDMAQWALGWCLANRTIASVVVGSKTMAQLEANAAAADLDVKRA